MKNSLGFYLETTHSAEAGKMANASFTINFSWNCMVSDLSQKKQTPGIIYSKVYLKSRIITWDEIL